MNNLFSTVVASKPIAESLLLTISEQSAFLIDFEDVELVKSFGKWSPYKGNYTVRDKYDDFGRCMTVDRLIMSKYHAIGKMDVIEHINGNVRDCRKANMQLRQRLAANQPIGGEAKEKITAKIFSSHAQWLESLPGSISEHVRNAVEQYKNNYKEN